MSAENISLRGARGYRQKISREEATARDITRNKSTDDRGSAVLRQDPMGQEGPG